jgi:hypothetical protein
MEIQGMWCKTMPFLQCGGKLDLCAFDFKYFSSCDLGTIFRQLMFCSLKIPLDKNLEKESSKVAAFYNGLAKIGKSEKYITEAIKGLKNYGRWK